MAALHFPTSAAVPPAAPSLSPALRSLQAIEEIEEHWEDMVTQLREHIPGLRSQRAFYDGAWVMGLRVGGREHVGPPKNDGAPIATLPFSRLDVQITLDMALDRAELVSRITVRNRDEPRQEFETCLDAPGRAALKDFLEQAAFTFVDRYFDRS